MQFGDRPARSSKSLSSWAERRVACGGGVGKMAAEGAGWAGRRAVEGSLAFSVWQARRQKTLEILRLRAAHTPPTALPPPPPVRRSAQD